MTRFIALLLLSVAFLPPAASELWSRDLVSSRDLSPAQAEAILNIRLRALRRLEDALESGE